MGACAGIDERYDLGTALNALGVLDQQRGELKAAESKLREAVAIRKEFADKDPKRYSAVYATSLGHLGRVQDQTRQLPVAGQSFELAAALLREAAGSNPSLLWDAFVALDFWALAEATSGRAQALREAIGQMFEVYARMPPDEQAELAHRVRDYRETLAKLPR